jgi:hypothetical protein
MLWKDLAVGKYVTFNRWLRDYSNLYCETLEIIYVPDTKEDGEVGCRRVTHNGYVCTNNKYADGETRYIKYIHLREVNVDPYACLKWNKGDVLVPTDIGVERLSKPQLNRSPYVVDTGTIWYDRYRDRNDLRVYIAPSDGNAYSMPLNVAYFKKADNAWKGLFASQYYKKEIKFDENGELVKPVTVAKGSPAYNQILKEAKACGVIKG